MDLTLKRTAATLYGVYGQLLNPDGKVVASTLEHAYPDGKIFVPKVALGRYTCQRHAPNRLNYETFELQNVPPFQGAAVTGILLHVGNYNKDSDGCILLGDHVVAGCLVDSRIAFEQFMELQNGIDSFNLDIVG